MSQRRETSTPANPDRRRFLQQSALGTAAAVAGRATAAEEPARPPRGKTKIRIGTRISPAWLKSDKDNDLRFLKQIGVDYVDITLDAVKGYTETGSFTAQAL